MEVATLRHLRPIRKKGHQGKAGSTVKIEIPKPFSWTFPTFGTKKPVKLYSKVFFNLSEGYSSYFTTKSSTFFTIIPTIP